MESTDMQERTKKVLETKNKIAEGFFKSESDDREWGPYNFLLKEITENKKLLAGYRVDGKKVVQNELDREQFCMNGVYLAYFFASENLNTASSIYQRLMSVYNPDGFWGSNKYNYYGQNWVWFGLELLSKY